MSWIDQFKILSVTGGKECPKDSPVIGISEDGYEIRKNNNGHFGGTYSEWYYIFINDKPVITDKYGVPKETKEISIEEKLQQIPIVKESIESNKNIFIFAGLGVLIYIFLKKR